MKKELEEIEENVKELESELKQEQEKNVEDLKSEKAKVCQISKSQLVVLCFW